jgi:septum formation protein
MEKVKLILASNSKWRREIINMAGLWCEQMPSSGDPDISFNNPDEYCMALSAKKAEEVASKVSEGIIIGADTIGYLDGKAFEKPKNREEAFKNFRELSGKVNYAVTGCTIIDKYKNQRVTFCEKVKVYFDELTDEEINWYIDNEANIYDCAGYSLETCASLFVSKIEGDYKAIIGLPICHIFEELKRWGYTINDFETYKDNK